MNICGERGGDFDGNSATSCHLLGAIFESAVFEEGMGPGL